MIITSAPAKIILCGEHAVVYGMPAIAIPVFGLKATVQIEPTEGDFQILALDTNETLSLADGTHPLVIAAQQALVDVDDGAAPKIRLTISSTIPIASGLGSGASVSTAIIKSIYQYDQTGIDYAKLNESVYHVEKLHHGTPSGIDNTVIVHEKPIYFMKDTDPESIDVNGNYQFIIADTGVPASTKTTVAAVKSLHEAAPTTTQHIFTEIQTLVEQIRVALNAGTPATLGKLLTQNHKLLQKLNVSSPELDKLVEAAIEAGALGAKLSGGGGGGNMIALVTENTCKIVEEALLTAGAKQTFTTELSE